MAAEKNNKDNYETEGRDFSDFIIAEEPLFDDVDDQGKRIVETKQLEEDKEENSFRPTTWEDYYGQDKIKANLQVFIEAATQRKEALDHVLLYGPPGLGKTTLAGIIAGQMGVQMHITTGPAIERQGDLAAMLTRLGEKDVLFIDEIHRLNRSIEEILYPAMEDYCLDIIIGKGPSAKSIRLDLPKFTLIGATTRAGLLSSPLRDRFGMIHRLEIYAPKDIQKILLRNAKVLQIEIDQEGLGILAERCRGTPRIAIRILRRMRDFAQIRGNGMIDKEIVLYGLNALDIDEKGLDRTDRNLLKHLALTFAGGPVGLDTMAAVTGEDAGTIEDVYEPYLMQLGFIAKTNRGRVLTELGWKHLGIEMPVKTKAVLKEGEKFKNQLTLDEPSGEE